MASASRLITILSRLGKQLLVVLILLNLERCVFFIFNHASFPTVKVTDFFVGSWIDWMTISLCFIPFVLIYGIPFGRLYKLKHAILGSIFILFNTFFAALNLMDVEYFQYTNKRSTADLFTILGAGNDLNQLLTTFITDFWLIILLFIGIVWASVYLWNKLSIITHYKEEKLGSNLFMLVVLIPLMIVSGRGGMQLKPSGVMEVTQLANPEVSGLVLNTPFTMIKSIGKDQLEEKNYFAEAEAKKYFNPIKQSKPARLLPDKTNVVVIILESFGNEYVGFFNKENRGYTPFFDSILSNSLTFDMGIANGKKSIEAVPAILASIPNLMDNPYISSPYATNDLDALPKLLKTSGYTSAFFHGATNGSMRFDAFAKQCGFDQYFGRFEYGNDAHFDKTWGILDEYFNPWTARKITSLTQPFFATLFTLSSHHPYYVPSKWKNKLKKGPHPIYQSIHYGDMSLRKFFDAAKKQSWYNNTLFVLVADHTPATSDPFYSQKDQMYRIPIAFYDPKKRLPKNKSNVIFQQLDILPTLLDLLNIETTYYAYGNSFFNSTHREGVTFLEGALYYFHSNQLITFTKEKARNLQVVATKKGESRQPLPINHQTKTRLEKRIKSMIQRYNSDLIRNKMTVE